MAECWGWLEESRQPIERSCSFTFCLTSSHIAHLPPPPVPMSALSIKARSSCQIPTLHLHDFILHRDRPRSGRIPLKNQVSEQLQLMKRRPVFQTVTISANMFAFRFSSWYNRREVMKCQFRYTRKTAQTERNSFNYSLSWSQRFYARI